MLALKQTANRVPGVPSACDFARFAHQWLTLRGRPAEDVFTDIVRGKTWGGQESLSGPGSDLLQTSVVRHTLPAVFGEFDVHTMLDIPCGDFHWMKHVDLESVDYIGADIVADLIERNRQYETSRLRFRKLNLLKDKLPTVDLVFCRDCLVHLSFKDAFFAFHNVCDSGSTYLLTTTFTSRRRNRNIATGQWRPLNLEADPFSLPPPLKTITEECSEGDGVYRDKSLGLWRAADIAQCLTTRSH